MIVAVARKFPRETVSHGGHDRRSRTISIPRPFTHPDGLHVIEIECFNVVTSGRGRNYAGCFHYALREHPAVVL